MDSSNPQHYQPLSHALRLPIGANATVSPSNTYIRKPARREEEEDEDAEEDVVEQELSRDQPSRPTSPAEKTPRLTQPLSFSQRVYPVLVIPMSSSSQSFINTSQTRNGVQADREDPKIANESPSRPPSRTSLQHPRILVSMPRTSSTMNSNGESSIYVENSTELPRNLSRILIP